MNKSVLFLKVIFSIILFLHVLSSCKEKGNDPMEAGFSAVNITPDEGIVKDSLYAKAVVFRQGDETGAIVICDIIMIRNDWTKEVREIIGGSIDIPIDNIAVSATHTHSAAFRDDLPQKIAEAIIMAYNNLEEVNLKTGTAMLEGLAYNRRFLMVDGTVRMNPSIDPETGTSFENGHPYMNPEIVRPVGPVDTEMSIIWISSVSDETPLGQLSSYAMHTCVFGEGISADYPGFMQRKLSEEFGDGFVSISCEGASGDINNWNVREPMEGQNGPARSKEIGEIMAVTVSSALESLAKAKPELKIVNQRIEVPLNPVSEMDIEWARAAVEDSFKDFGPTGFNQRGFLAGVRARKILRIADLQENGIYTMDLEVIVFRLDAETAIVTLPGEVFVELGIKIKENSPFKNTFIIELTNNSCGYVPTLKAYSEGGYEVVTSRTAPGTGEKLVETAIRILKELSRRNEI